MICNVIVLIKYNFVQYVKYETRSVRYMLSSDESIKIVLKTGDIY